jgi:hypothetical protein
MERQKARSLLLPRLSAAVVALHEVGADSPRNRFFTNAAMNQDSYDELLAEVSTLVTIHCNP